MRLNQEKSEPVKEPIKAAAPAKVPVKAPDVKPAEVKGMSDADQFE